MAPSRVIRRVQSVSFPGWRVEGFEGGEGMGLRVGVAASSGMLGCGVLGVKKMSEQEELR